MVLCACIDVDEIQETNSIRDRVIQNPKRSTNERVKQIKRIMIKIRRDIIIINIQICRHMILDRVKGKSDIKKLLDFRKRKQELVSKLYNKKETLKLLKRRKYRNI